MLFQKYMDLFSGTNLKYILVFSNILDNVIDIN